MKLIKPSFEIIEQGYKLDDIYRHIELCGRTCYASSHHITDGSAKPFVDRMIASRHTAMLEHGTCYIFIPEADVNKFGCKVGNFIIRAGHSRVMEWNKKGLVLTTNLRALVENDALFLTDYICRPTVQHTPRYTVRFVCNRQVSHEFVRHRAFSFAQQSTRFCNYSKDKFGSELTFIEPCWKEMGFREPFAETLEVIENNYMNLISRGFKPEQAATILPNAIRTELVMTGYIDDWKHFFDLRALGTTGKPHPQAEELAAPLMQEFIKRGYLDA